MEKNDKRRFKRVVIQGSCVICRDQTGQICSVSAIRDLSEGGMGLYTRDEVQIGSEVRFNFILPKNAGNKVLGIGHVVWAVPFKDVFGEPVFRCGVKFHYLPSSSLTTIKKYVRVGNPAS